MKKLTHLMLIGLPLLAFSSASLSAENPTTGFLVKSKYKKTVSVLLNDQLGNCLNLSSGESCLLDTGSKKESNTISIIDVATGKVVNKFRATVSTDTVSHMNIEDLSPKNPEAPVVSPESGDKTVDANNKPVEQPAIVLSDNPAASPADNASSNPASSSSNASSNNPPASPQPVSPEESAPVPAPSSGSDNPTPSSSN